MRPLQAFVLRTGTGPLGWVWHATYAALARAIAACLRYARLCAQAAGVGSGAGALGRTASGSGNGMPTTS